MCRFLFISIALVIASTTVFAEETIQDVDYRGSRKPYPVTASLSQYPDSLTPVMINHVGRHGSRYATSPAKIKNIISWLKKAETAGTITEKGEKLLTLTEHVDAISEGHWGELDSIGIAEQRGIATRMYDNYPDLFNRTNVSAISSYVPRCVMSMYSFCHMLTQRNDHISIIAASGPQTNPLMRPFETNTDYENYAKEKPFQKALKKYQRSIMPLNVAGQMMGTSYPMTDKQAEDLVSDIYYMISSCSAIGLNVDPMQFFTADEYSRMWKAADAQQYLIRNANDYSSIPADIAANLVMDLITTTQNFIDGTDTTPVHLRFGHAETIMPLVSLLHLPGCYVPKGCPIAEIPNYWQNCNIIPMASNLQLILFRSTTGNYYLKAELNERPLIMVPESKSMYTPWGEARAYMLKCVPAK